jgi:hypothetical protein
MTNTTPVPQTTEEAPMPPTGWRILGFGKHPAAAAAIQNRLRTLGLRATNFALTDNPEGDARLVAALQSDNYDGIAIGGFINGQDAHDVPATETTTLWFNRVLNLIHAHAPGAKIILVRNPADALLAVERVLGPSASK